MAQKNTPVHSLAYGWDYGEDGWKDGADASMLKIDALLNLSVISATTTADPGSPSEGDRYVVPAGGTGAFAGEDDNIAFYINAGWVFYPPREGMTAWVEDDKVHIVYDSGSWAGIVYPYDIGLTFGGTMSDAEVLLRYPIPRDVTFPSGLTGSQCVANIASTAQLILSVRKDNIEFGTITFAIAGTVATFAAASDAVFVAGDILTIVTPVTADTTLADLGLALVGIR